MTQANQNILTNFVLAIFKLNDGKLAKTINKLLLHAILAIFCIHIVNGITASFNASFAQLGDKAAHAGIVANITVINKSGNSFNGVVKN